MVKKKVIISLFLFSIIFIFNFLLNLISIDNGITVSAIYETESEFLSDNYFDELNELMKSNGNSKKIIGEQIINKMMDDLEQNPDDLKGNKNFTKFFETFDENINNIDNINERMHFFRNKLNSYSDAPAKLDDMVTLASKGEWKVFSAKFHRYNYEDINGALNIKFISKDGRFEAVYNIESQSIVTDPANMGTYNYAPGSINIIKFYNHTKYDKKPWKKWGNIEGFSYEDIMKLKSEHGTAESKNAYKEIEKMIKEGRGT